MKSGVPIGGIGAPVSKRLGWATGTGTTFSCGTDSGVFAGLLGVSGGCGGTGSGTDVPVGSVVPVDMVDGVDSVDIVDGEG